MGSAWRRNALELARQAAELLVERFENLPETEAWDGDFRTALADRLVEEPPEEGRRAEEVIDRAAREILPFATRLDDPRSFAFVPSSPTWPGVLADFIGVRVPHQCRHLADGERPGPARTGRHRLVPAVGRIPRRSRRPLHERGFGGHAECLRGGAGSGGQSRVRRGVPEQPEPQRARPRRHDHRDSARPGSAASG